MNRHHVNRIFALSIIVGMLLVVGFWIYQPQAQENEQRVVEVEIGGDDGAKGESPISPNATIVPEDVIIKGRLGVKAGTGNFQMAVLDSGVGIGTVSPGNPLSVVSANSSVPLALISNAADTGRMLFQMGAQSNTENTIVSLTSDAASSKDFAIAGWGLGNVNRIKLAANTTYMTGNVGIGTLNPAGKLEIADTNSTTLRITGTDVNATTFLQFLEATNVAGIEFQYVGDGPGGGVLFINDFGPSAPLMVIERTGNVGIGTPNPQGRLDVNGAIFQRGSELHADYVFEPDYELESIEEHGRYMWKHKHLLAIPKATVDAQGREILELGAHRKGIVEELEKAHVYIQQLHEQLKAQQKVIDAQSSELTEMKTEMAQFSSALQKLEALVAVGNNVDKTVIESE